MNQQELFFGSLTDQPYHPPALLSRLLLSRLPLVVRFSLPQSRLHVALWFSLRQSRLHVALWFSLPQSRLHVALWFSLRQSRLHLAWPATSILCLQQYNPSCVPWLYLCTPTSLVYTDNQPPCSSPYVRSITIVLSLFASKKIEFFNGIR